MEIGNFPEDCQQRAVPCDAVIQLLDTYGLEDPAAGTALGEFVNPNLQVPYNELTAQGSQSLGSMCSN